MGRATGAIALLLLSIGLTGCFPQEINTKALSLLQRNPKATDKNSLYLQTVLLERPLGDELLNTEIWKTAAHPSSHAQTTLLDINGLRMGVLTGLIPGRFSDAIRSEDGTIQPMHRSFQEGVPRVVPINGTIEKLQFQYLSDLAADRQVVELFAAECGVQVIATVLENDRIRLEIEPQIQHGEKQALLKPSADGSQFDRVDRKPLEAYTPLKCEVVLGPSDYLILGCEVGEGDTLGEGFFVSTTSGRVKQRVLVIRAGRGVPVVDPDIVLGR